MTQQLYDDIEERMRKKLGDVITLSYDEQKYNDIIHQANLGLLKASGRWCDLCDDLKKEPTYYDVKKNVNLCMKHIIALWRIEDLNGFKI